MNAAVDDWKSAAQAVQVRIDKQPKTVNSNTYLTLAQYLYLAGDTKGGDQAAAQAKKAKGANPPPIHQPAQAVQAARPAAPGRDQAAHQAAADPGRRRSDRWRSYRRRASGGANPLNGLGTGGLSGGGGL